MGARGWLRAWVGRVRKMATGMLLWEMATLFLVTSFLLFYGLVPIFGGDQLGLVGADEPRYAQISREMLAAHDAECGALHTMMMPESLKPHALKDAVRCVLAGTITPMLYGQPWLEKPALYYWRAMGFFREFGVSDWSARLPSSTGAFVLVVLVFLHLRRFRPGGHLDAAIITASCVGILSFARGASTDMQLAAPFCIGMLGWYAWYETGKKFWLFDLYFFGAAATLAKGPIAPFMALGIILLFAGLRREWSLLRRTIWWPGVLLYMVMVLPWYIAVQWKNPTFLRFFLLEHNLERFATDRYQHHQPFWYYGVVVLIGLMPWTAMAIRAMVDAAEVSIAEWKVRHNPQRYLGHTRAGDAFPEFLVLWALFPIVFFSFSGSKLPGYILPSIPPFGILAGDYLFRIRREGVPRWLLWLHAALCGVLVLVVVLAPQHMEYGTFIPPARWIVIGMAAAIGMAVAVWWIVRWGGVRLVASATLAPVLGSMIFLLGFHGSDLDLNYSARPLAREIQHVAPGEKVVAVADIKRDMDYGLAFYRNEPVIHYEIDQTGQVAGNVPPEEHVLVIKTVDAPKLEQWLSGRVYEPLFLYDWQGLSVYKVYPRR